MPTNADGMTEEQDNKKSIIITLFTGFTILLLHSSQASQLKSSIVDSNVGQI